MFAEISLQKFTEPSIEYVILVLVMSSWSLPLGMSCGNPPPVQNGKLNFTGTSYNSTAHYTCNEGYDLNTDPVKRCTAKKRWDGLTPRCCKLNFCYLARLTNMLINKG